MHEMESERKYLYICDSMYHIYVSLLKTIALPGVHSILIKDSILNSEDLRRRLVDSCFFKDVYLIPELELIENRKRNPFVILKLSQYFGTMTREIIQGHKVFLFLDTSFYAQFLIKHYPMLDITLVEDGEQIYANFNCWYKDRIKKMLRMPIGYGRDKAIKSIEIQFPERLDENRRSKSKLLDLKSLEDGVVDSYINSVFSVFGFAIEDLKLNNTSILLTQPLSEDGFISENEKIILYHRIIKDFMAEESIVIKVHPREKTDYEKWFPNCVVIPGYFPVELLNYASVSISKGVTLFSSALNNLQMVKEKLILGIDYSPKIKQMFKTKRGLEF